jgi:glycosyltransferase involved in cell wall biosynthesis
LAALKSLGHDVVLASATLSSETPWTAESIAALRDVWVAAIEIFRPGTADLRYFRQIAGLFSTAGQLITEEQDPCAAFHLAIESYRSPGMRTWFTDLCEKHHIECIIMSYAISDGLVDHTRFQNLPRIIDIHDLWSVQLALRHAVARHLHNSVGDPAAFDASALDEEFFTRLDLQPDPEELRILAQYDRVLTLSRSEEGLLRASLPPARLVYMPVALAVPRMQPRYGGSAYFPAGPHIFNVQGYAYFLRRVLPTVLRRTPDFSLLTTGTWYRDAHPVTSAHVTHAGFVPSTTAIYEDARFVIAPILGGTGQPVKIVEAMAHGVPVVATAAAARESPLEHGVNGFVAGTAEEFAAYTSQLWRDQDLCRRLGHAARATIEQHFTLEHLAVQLAKLLSGSTASG